MIPYYEIKILLRGKLMKRLLILSVVIICLLLSACGKKGTSNDTVSIVSSNPSDTAVSEAELLYDVWQIKYYSSDNETYKEYDKDISANGVMTFYTDSTAEIAWNEDEVATYNFALSPEKDVITFTELDGDKTMDFYFGFKIIKDENGKRMVLSRYNATEKEIDYFVLLPTE